MAAKGFVWLVNVVNVPVVQEKRRAAVRPPKQAVDYARLGKERRVAAMPCAFVRTVWDAHQMARKNLSLNQQRPLQPQRMCTQDL